MNRIYHGFALNSIEVGGFFNLHRMAHILFGDIDICTALMRYNKGTAFELYAKWGDLSEEDKGRWSMVERNLNKLAVEERDSRRTDV